MISKNHLCSRLALAVLSVATFALPAQGEEAVTLSSLAQRTHVHGIAIDPTDPRRLYLATHHGFFLVSPDGMATRVSVERHDFMGFTPHPTDPAILYASGHPAGGGNLGVIASIDGGHTWLPLAEGAKGPVDFHQMDVSKVDPKTIYGVFGGIEVSRDGGHTWQIVAPPPDRLIDLAASAAARDTIYAATESGLKVSRDGGTSWQPEPVATGPTSMVEVGSDGTVYAFVIGRGLISTSEDRLADWQTLSNGFGDGYVLHLAIDPTDGDKLYAVLHDGRVMASTDGGRLWNPFGSP
jgi:photosystem II stability/assembly factor-like uncharacterized protein